MKRYAEESHEFSGGTPGVTGTSPREILVAPKSSVKAAARVLRRYSASYIQVESCNTRDESGVARISSPEKYEILFQICRYCCTQSPIVEEFLMIFKGEISKPFQ